MNNSVILYVNINIYFFHNIVKIIIIFKHNQGIINYFICNNSYFQLKIYEDRKLSC